MPQRRFVYLLLSKDCKVLAAETGLKKLVELHGEKYHLPKYRRLVNILKPAKEAGEQVEFEALDGTLYKLAAPQVH